MSDLARANLAVASGTAVSRLTGLARVAAVAWVFGQTALADAYGSANNAPNVIYELAIGGALAAGLVPTITQAVDADDDEAVSSIVSVSVVGLAALTVAAVLAAPWIFTLYSIEPFAGVDAGEFRRAGTLLTRVFVVQIFFYGLTALGSAMLHARDRFVAAAWAPALANIALVIALWSLPAAPATGWDLGDVVGDGRLLATLALGATGGIAVTAVVVGTGAASTVRRLRWRFRPGHPAVRRLLRMSAWTAGYVACNHAVIVVIRNLAEPGSGGQDAWSKAYTFFVLPHGLLAVSLATTFAPGMARAIGRGDTADFARRTSTGIRLTLIATVPAAVGMLLLRRPIIGALLQRGQFGADGAERTADVLGALSVGLVGFSVYLFALRGFYAHHDARTPFVVNLLRSVLAIACCVALSSRFGVAGLAGGFAIAANAAAIAAVVQLTRRTPAIDGRSILITLTRALASGAALALVVATANRSLGADEGGGALLRIGLGAPLGLGAYTLALWSTGSSEARHAVAWARRHLDRDRADAA